MSNAGPETKSFLTATPGMLALEPRILLDAAALVSVVDAVETADSDPVEAEVTTSSTETEQQEIQEIFENVDFAATSNPTSIIFVDSRVKEIEPYIQEIPEHTLIVELTADSDGIDQISETLAQYQDIESIHVLSHGDQAQLILGSTILDSQALAGRSDDLSGWSNYLSADADILLYGCDVAQGDEGQAFIESLAAITDADVRASDDTTGIGGDWELEESAGVIETASLAIDAPFNLEPIYFNSGDIVSTDIGSDTADIINDTDITLSSASEADGTLDINSNSFTNADSGIIDIESDSYVVIDGSFYNQGEININEGSTLEINISSGTFDSDGGYWSGGGTIVVKGNGNADITSPFEGATIDLSDGDLDVLSVVGDGSLNGSTILDLEGATVIIGLTSEGGDSFNADISGTGAGKVSLSGGTLNLDFQEEFTLRYGDTFLIVENAQQSSSTGFLVITSNFGDSDQWITIYQNGGYYVQYIGTDYIVNTDPVAKNDIADAVEDGGTVSVDVLNNDLDQENDYLIVSSVNQSGTTGTVSIAVDGQSVSYDPGSNFQLLKQGETTTDSFQYTISDGNGGTDTATVTVTITGTNDGPVLVGSVTLPDQSDAG